MLKMEPTPLIAAGLVFFSISLLVYYFFETSAAWKPDGTLDQTAMVKQISGFHRRLGLGKYIDGYQHKIIEAGLVGGSIDGEKILLFKEIVTLFICFFSFALDLPFIMVIWFVAGGFFLPDIYLRDRKNKRIKAVVRALPDFLDLLTLVVSAGLDFGNAVQTVIEKGKRSPLTQELEIVLREIRLGAPRATALQNMAKRLKIRDINLFINAVIQADQLGTGLAFALRNQSDSTRERRMQRAEKLALEAPVKMIFPLVFFIFPVVFIVLIGPIIGQWMK